MEMCNQQDNLVIYRNETENNITYDSKLLCSNNTKTYNFKRSLEDYKFKLKKIIGYKFNDSSFIDFMTAKQENKNKIVMSPIGFTRTEEKTYEDSILSKIFYINNKQVESKIEIIDKKDHVKTFDFNNKKTNINLRKKIEDDVKYSKLLKYNNNSSNNNGCYLATKKSTKRNYQSRHLDFVDLALLKNMSQNYKNEEYGKKEEEQSKKEGTYMKITSIYDKKRFSFPKIDF